MFEKDGEILRPRFLLFDLMYLNRLKIDADFSQRLHLINKEIIRPRDEAVIFNLSSSKEDWLIEV